MRNVPIFDQFADKQYFYKHIDPPHTRLYLRALLRALQDIHARAIVHRDVKPANFLFDYEEGSGVLVDFGLAEVCFTIAFLTALTPALHTTSSTNLPARFCYLHSAPRCSFVHERYPHRGAGSIRRSQEEQAWRRPIGLSTRG